MQNRTTILLFLLLLCGIAWLVRISFTVPDQIEPPTSAIPSTHTLKLTNTAFSDIPQLSSPPAELFSEPDEKNNFNKKILTETTARWLAGKEGSYTNLNQLFQNDGTFSVDLNSEWAARYLFPDRNLPSLRIRVIKNSETGEYEPVGGTLTLPGSSLEAGYETDPVSGENKATLQWKKSF